MAINWNGVFPAVTTKFTKDDQLDMSLFKKNLDAQIKAGVSGIILGGTLGEASVLLESEKEKLVKETISVVTGRCSVILNIAEGSTREAIRQADLAKKWGADGLMLLPPMRYRSDFRETLHYFKDVATSTDLPIMLYNNPVDYKTEITLEMFEELQSVSNIQAVKESTRDVTNITRMINRFGDRFKILCGVDTITMESLVMGAHGLVAGLVCAFPEETVRLFNLIQNKRYDEALIIYRWFMPLLELDIHPKLVQYIKLAETQVGLGSEYVRKPRLPLEGKERETILSIIETGIKNRPK